MDVLATPDPLHLAPLSIQPIRELVADLRPVRAISQGHARVSTGSAAKAGSSK